MELWSASILAILLLLGIVWMKWGIDPLILLSRSSLALRALIVTTFREFGRAAIRIRTEFPSEYARLREIEGARG